MRAVILSAGQGKRLLPLTENVPKCMLDVGGKQIMQWQVDALLAAGFERVCLIVGYAAADVERQLENRYGTARVSTIFNPFYGVADNLATCWMARQEMHDEFLLINGDTLFHPRVLESLRKAPDAPITVTVDQELLDFIICAAGLHHIKNFLAQVLCQGCV